MGAAVRFKHVNVPRQQGEQARLKVVHGPDFGAVYVITGARATLGRGEENDIMVSDLKASRRHAEFTNSGAGWHVKDLGSANGLLHNGKTTRLALVKTSDILTFGETTLEFMASEAGTLMLVAPPRDAGQLRASHDAFEDQRKKARAFGAPSASKAGAGPKGEAAKNPKFLIYGVLLLGAAFLLLGEDTAPKPKAKKKNEQAEDLRKYLPGTPPDPVTAKSIDQFFRAGFREYIAGNYLRAKAQFDIVLQMSPGHAQATLYIENCNNELKAAVATHLRRGKQGIEAGKLKEARASYEAIQRILFREQTNPAYIEAGEQLIKVNKLIANNGNGEDSV